MCLKEKLIGRPAAHKEREIRLLTYRVYKTRTFLTIHDVVVLLAIGYCQKRKIYIYSSDVLVGVFTRVKSKAALRGPLAAFGARYNRVLRPSTSYYYFGANIPTSRSVYVDDDGQRNDCLSGSRVFITAVFTRLISDDQTRHPSARVEHELNKRARENRTSAVMFYTFSPPKSTLQK